MASLRLRGQTKEGIKLAVLQRMGGMVKRSWSFLDEGESWSLQVQEDIEEEASLNGGDLGLFCAGLWSSTHAWQAGLQTVSVGGA